MFYTKIWIISITCIAINDEIIIQKQLGIFIYSDLNGKITFLKFQKKGQYNYISNQGRIQIPFKKKNLQTRKPILGQE